MTAICRIGPPFPTVGLTREGLRGVMPSADASNINDGPAGCKAETSGWLHRSPSGIIIGMIRENTRELLDRDLFIPFRLVLSSGGHYDIMDHHSAALLKSEVFVVFPDGER